MPLPRSAAPLALAATLVMTAGCATAPAPSTSYADLLALFEDWREFETPPLRDGVPDYTPATTAARHTAWRALDRRLTAIDPSGWPVAQQVDWQLVRAELNGFDFDHRVLRPWQRDPAFYKSLWTYQSDVPAHEGPCHHALVELWTYSFPLTPNAAERLATEIETIPPLLDQARGNLTGDARDLWIGGIRTLKEQSTDLATLAAEVGTGTSPRLADAIRLARVATDGFVAWLERELPNRNGPSGIGKDNYTWYLQNVHLVPLTWEDEVRLLERELTRAWSSLKLEEHRNRDRPELVAAATPDEYDRLADQGASRLMTFLAANDVMPVVPNMEPALREHLGAFVPESRRNFFWIGAHLDPVPLYTHFYHWWDLARMRDDPHPSPIRQRALLYNIFDSRAEGIATGVEEMFLHAGLYDDQPRSREIVWIMLAQRAARGLGSLWAHANEMTMAEAGSVHVKWTPRGWMRTEPELLAFEQHLYLRQPGYGTSYVTGKYLVEQLAAEVARQREERGEPFVLREFFAELNDKGVIPMSLIRWEMTGLDDQVPTRPGFGSSPFRR